MGSLEDSFSGTWENLKRQSFYVHLAKLSIYVQLTQIYIH